MQYYDFNNEFALELFIVEDRHVLDKDFFFIFDINFGMDLLDELLNKQFKLVPGFVVN